MYKIKFDFYKFKWKITNVPMIWFDSKKQAKIYLKNFDTSISALIVTSIDCE